MYKEKQPRQKERTKRRDISRTICKENPSVIVHIVNGRGEFLHAARTIREVACIHHKGICGAGFPLLLMGVCLGPFGTKVKW